jgi:hypothetical protein
MSLIGRKQQKTLFLIAFGALFLVPAFSFSAVPGVEKIEVFQARKGLRIILNRPPLSEAESVILTRKEGQCPEGFYDGEEIYRGNGVEFIDRGAKIGKKYCYGAYIYSLAGFSSQMTKSALVEKKGPFAFIAEFLKQNDMIVWGALVIIVLLFVNHKTMNEKERIFADLRTDIEG